MKDNLRSDIPALATKFHPPRYQHIVERQTLRHRFSAARDAQLVLITAPAGFGKTVALLEYKNWLRERDVATAWLSLDAGDDDPRPLLAHLALAVAEIIPEQTHGSAPCGPDDPPARGLWRLLDLAWQHDQPFALLLNDLDAIATEDCLAILGKLIDAVPPHGQVVITSREMPALGIPRLKAKGAVVEIGAADLCFTEKEGIGFLQQLAGDRISGDDSRALWQHLEGWPAGLQLAALAARNGEHYRTILENPQGLPADIAAYLTEEVFLRLPSTVQSFLLQTCVLDTLDGGACAALTGSTDARETLDFLERKNLFLVALDPQHNQYRYQGLFRDFLQMQLARRMPKAIVALHRKAANHFRNTGRMALAVEHALASDDQAFVIALLEQCAFETTLSGRFHTVRRWFAHLPEETWDRHPELGLTAAWNNSFLNRAEDTLELIARLESRKRQATPGETTAEELLALRWMNTVMADRVGDFGDIVAGLPPGNKIASPVAAATIENTRAFCLTATDRFAEAIECTQRARLIHTQLQSHFGILSTDCLSSLAYLAQGKLLQAEAQFADGTGPAQEQPNEGSSADAWTATVRTEILYERDDLPGTRELLLNHLDLIRETSLLDFIVIAYRILGRVALAETRYDQALAFYQEAAQLGERRHHWRIGALMRMEIRRAELLWEKRDVQELLTLHEQDLPGWHRYRGWALPSQDVDTPALHGARLEIAAGRADGAIKTLRRQLRHALARGRLRRALKARVLLAWALRSAGRTAEACRAMGAALRYAESEGYVRTFVEEGDTVMGIVAQVCRTMIGDDEEPQRADYLRRLLRSRNSSVVIEPEAKPEQAAPIAPLTRQERRVLELMANGLSNQDIAQKLFVSEPTVKFHLRNILVKTTARNRTHAVAIALRRGLIS